MLRWTALLLIVTSLSACTSAFLVPDNLERLTPDQLGMKYEDVWLEAADGVRIHGWNLKAQGQRKGTVLFFHGNAQNISAHIASVYWLPELGFDVFMLDPRGYGLSEGPAGIDGVHLDAMAALEFVSSKVCGEIVVFGQSLGGAVGIYTVAHSENSRCVRAVISEGAFSSYRRIATEKLNGFWLTWAFQWPLSYLFSDEYSPEAAVSRLSPIPLLIVHGEDDNIVPHGHAIKLFKAAKQPRELWLLPGERHITAVRNDDYRTRLVEWMNAALKNESSIVEDVPVYQ